VRILRPEKKNLRKLVTLSPELIERIEKFQRESGASSESEALKTLIEDGLKMRDTPYDLFRRCESATNSGQRLGDIVDRLVSDHPLVESSVVNSDGLSVYIKTDADEADQRFHYSRARRVWKWEQRVTGYGNDGWEAIDPIDPNEPPRASSSSKPSGRGRTPVNDLDDEIPF